MNPANRTSFQFLPKMLMAAGVLLFFSGIAVGSLAQLIWDRNEVKPVVLCRYDSIKGFLPLNNSGSLSPSWEKSEVTPMAEVRYDPVFEFVPRYTDSVATSPKWTRSEVTAWTEVVPDNVGMFKPKNQQ